MKLNDMEKMNDTELKEKGIIFLYNKLIALKLTYNNLIISEAYSKEFEEIKEILEKRLENTTKRLERIIKEMM